MIAGRRFYDNCWYFTVLNADAVCPAMPRLSDISKEMMHESTKTWLTGLLGQATKEKVYGVRTIENGLVILGRIFIVAASLQGGGAVVTPQKS